MSNRKSLIENSEPSTIEEKIVKINGDIATRTYNKGRFLGKGGFARVYEFYCIDNQVVSAAKLISKSSLNRARARQKLMSEIKIHRSLHHPNIVLFEHFFEDSENVYILLELCSNQTLNELIRRRKRLTELEARCYIAQLISALKYLHSHRIIHRDIKLGNLFLNEKLEIKLGDFGLATKLEFDGERKRTICGTPNYIAPEVIDGKQGHSYEVDVWSLGVLLFTLVVGKPPFETNEVKTTYRRIKMNAYSFPDNLELSSEVKNLISRILVNDPLSRPSLDEILQHPFFLAGYPILMPLSTLAVPPPSSYIKKYQNSEFTEARTQPLPSKTNQLEKQTEKAELEMETPKSAKKATTGSSYRETEGGPQTWVTKWVDYSSKYGLGYLLSDGGVGVYFNDSTKISSSPDGQEFQYIHRVGPSRQEETAKYKAESYPSQLKKKVTLLYHFKKHLGGETKKTGRLKEFTYVKKWLTTAHAIIFRLSNKIVEVCFQDKTEIILCSSSRMVTYVNKKGEISTYPLRSASDSTNVEMTKRLRYTKDVLTNMLNPSAGAGEILSNR